MTDDLIAFLRERCDEDERIAREALAIRPGHWKVFGEGGIAIAAPDDWATVVYDEGEPTRQQAEHIARHDPARVLREVEAKRRILAMWDDYGNNAWGLQFIDGFQAAHEMALQLLALPYADHPDYRAEWRP